MKKRERKARVAGESGSKRFRLEPEEEAGKIP